MPYGFPTNGPLLSGMKVTRIKDIYAVTVTTPVSLGNDPVPYTQLSGMTLSFTLPKATPVIIGGYVASNKGGGSTHYTFFDNGVDMWGGNFNFMSQPTAEGTTVHAAAYEYCCTLKAGLHRIAIYESAANTTNGVTFNARTLYVILLG